MNVASEVLQNQSNSLFSYPGEKEVADVVAEDPEAGGNNNHGGHHVQDVAHLLQNCLMCGGAAPKQGYEHIKKKLANKLANCAQCN